jgi:hypothetical protein
MDSPDSHLAATYAAYRRLHFPTGMLSALPDEDEQLADLQIDLDLEDDALTTRVDDWIKHGRAPEAIELDMSIDERLSHSSWDGPNTDARERASAYRAGQLEVARALHAASGVPIRHRPWHPH